MKTARREIYVSLIYKNVSLKYFTLLWTINRTQGKAICDLVRGYEICNNRLVSSIWTSIPMTYVKKERTHTSPLLVYNKTTSVLQTQAVSCDYTEIRYPEFTLFQWVWLKRFVMCSNSSKNKNRIRYGLEFSLIPFTLWRNRIYFLNTNTCIWNHKVRIQE